MTRLDGFTDSGRLCCHRKHFDQLCGVSAQWLGFCQQLELLPPLHPPKKLQESNLYLKDPSYWNYWAARLAVMFPCTDLRVREGSKSQDRPTKPGYPADEAWQIGAKPFLHCRIY